MIIIFFFFFFLDQQYENVTESGIEPETFPLQEGHSTIRAISVRLSDRHIPALYTLVIHPILKNATQMLKSTVYFTNDTITVNLLLFCRKIRKCSFMQFFLTVWSTFKLSSSIYCYIC